MRKRTDMEQVIVNDVAPRDGLQNHPTAVSPADRASLVNGLVDAGVPAVEVASFVSPRAVPRMAGAAELVARLDLDRADFSALVPNRKGYELACDAGIRSIAPVLSATETMNRENINMGLDEATGVCRDVLQQASSDGLEARCYLSVAFECPFEGTVPDAEIERLATAMFEAGATEIIVADTIGAGNPARAKALFGRMVAAFGAGRLAAHPARHPGTRARQRVAGAGMRHPQIRCVPGWVGRLSVRPRRRRQPGHGRPGQHAAPGRVPDGYRSAGPAGRARPTGISRRHPRGREGIALAQTPGCSRVNRVFKDLPGPPWGDAGR